MLDPSQPYAQAIELEVLQNDPTSLVERKAQEFWLQRKRTCNRHRRIIAAQDCYMVATAEGNNNTLFLIPETDQDVTGAGGAAMDAVEYYDVPQGNTQLQAQDRLAMMVKNLREEEDDDVVAQEMDNKANADIFSGGKVTIQFMVKDVKAGGDISKAAEGYEWKPKARVHPEVGDPYKEVEKKLQQMWKAGYKPHDKNLRLLPFEDCYKAAISSPEKALYMLKIRNETKKTGLPATVEHQQQNKHGHNLVASTAEAHRDKAAKVKQGKLGLSYLEDGQVQIRKQPQKMRE